MQYLIMCFFVFFIYSANASGTVNVVEIANFSCQECFKAQQYTNRIESAVKTKGGIFHFVPVFLNADHSWSSRVYFSMPNEFRNKAREAFYTANLNGITMKTAQSACVVIHDAILNYPVEECIKRASSTDSYEHIANAITLLHNIYKKPDTILLFPIFVIEKDDEIIATISRHHYEDVEQLVNEVARYVASL